MLDRGLIFMKKKELRHMQIKFIKILRHVYYHSHKVEKLKTPELSPMAQHMSY